MLETRKAKGHPPKKNRQHFRPFLAPCVRFGELERAPHDGRAVTLACGPTGSQPSVDGGSKHRTALTKHVTGDATPPCSWLYPLAAAVLPPCLYSSRPSRRDRDPCVIVLSTSQILRKNQKFMHVGQLLELEAGALSSGVAAENPG